MANTASAKKMVRKIERRTAVNKARRSRVRTYLRKVEEAIASGDKGAVTRGVFHKATVARKLSRLSSRIKALAA